MTIASYDPGLGCNRECSASQGCADGLHQSSTLTADLCAACDTLILGSARAEPLSALNLYQVEPNMIGSPNKKKTECRQALDGGLGEGWFRQGARFSRGPQGLGPERHAVQHGPTGICRLGRRAATTPRHLQQRGGQLTVPVQDELDSVKLGRCTTWHAVLPGLNGRSPSMAQRGSAGSAGQLQAPPPGTSSKEMGCWLCHPGVCSHLGRWEGVTTGHAVLLGVRGMRSGMALWGSAGSEKGAAGTQMSSAMKRGQVKHALMRPPGAYPEVGSRYDKVQDPRPALMRLPRAYPEVASQVQPGTGSAVSASAWPSEVLPVWMLSCRAAADQLQP